MKKFTLLFIAVGMLLLSSCTQDNPTKPAPVVPPTTNVITLSDGGVGLFDVYPSCSFVNLTSTTQTSMFIINMKIGISSTFNLTLTTYNTDTTDAGTFTEYNSLKDGDALMEFTNDGHGNPSKIYDYIVDSAVVTITNHTRNQVINSDYITGTYKLNLQPNTNSLAKTYKTVSGTFNTYIGNTTDQ